MSEPAIPWSRVAAFFRQHTHDVRNDLNGIDLEMELLHEAQTDPESKDSVRQIRKQLRSMEQRLRSLAILFHDVSPEASPIDASVLLQICREKHAELSEALKVSWVSQLDADQVNVDEEMMAQVLKELLDNAAAFPPDGPVTVIASAKGDEVLFEVVEPKKKPVSPDAWAAPFCSTRHGRNGLGLWAARRMAEANGASFQQHYDDKQRCLITRIALKKCR